MKSVFLLFAVFWSLAACAQDTDTVTIRGVDITESRVILMPGMKVRKIDSTILSDYTGAGLNEVLTWYSPLNFKDYGVSGFSIPVFRGTGGSHTKIIWNGIGINSGMNGQLDFSSLDAGAIQSLEVISGGNSALFGNGGFGGTIILRNIPDYANRLRLHVGLQAGSFGKRSATVSGAYGNAGWQGSTYLQYGSADNNFPIPGTSRIQKNAHRLHYGFMQDFNMKAGKKGSIALRSWYSMDNKDLQAPVSSPDQVTALLNESFRNMAEWNHRYRNIAWTLAAAHLYERIVYIDQALKLTETSITTSDIVKGDFNYPVTSKVSVYGGVEHTWENGWDIPFLEKHRRQLSSAWLRATYLLKPGWNIHATTRKSLIEQYAIPLAYSAGLEGKLFPELFLKLNASRDYHIPTLNDLYWNLGGNPALRSELGKHADAGLLVRISKGKWTNEAEAGAYWGIIDDWIQWNPGSGGIWSPKNLKQVELKGIELFYSCGFKNGEWKIRALADYTLSYSTNKKAAFANDQSVERQLIFIPYENAKINLQAEAYRFRFQFGHQFTGYRFISTDNQYFIPGYHIGRIGAGRNFNFRNITMLAEIAVDNLYNTIYQSLPNYAMPGRNYTLKCTFKF